MRLQRRWLAAAALALLAGAAWWWLDDRTTHFVSGDHAAFIARFDAPPAQDSATTRAELDVLLAIERSRTAADVAAAQADRPMRVARFYDALGFGGARPELPRLEKLAELVKDDVRLYVRAVKHRHRRLRPYEIEPRLHPCIADVRGDLSYPSGHAAFAWTMAELLSRIAPERRPALEARAEIFARQRLVCGVHFPSDLAAGKRAAALIMQEMEKNPDFRSRLAAAAQEYRAALAAGGSRATD